MPADIENVRMLARSRCHFAHSPGRLPDHRCAEPLSDEGCETACARAEIKDIACLTDIRLQSGAPHRQRMRREAPAGVKAARHRTIVINISREEQTLHGCGSTLRRD